MDYGAGLGYYLRIVGMCLRRVSPGCVWYKMKTKMRVLWIY